jgi:protein tyrosine/serine phosphatase
MFQRRSSTVLLAVLSLVVLAVCLAAYRHHHRYKHVAVHEPGMVYRSAWVEPDVMSELIEQHQIRAVVNLCNPGEMGEQRWVDQRRAVTNAGARLIELPMPLTVNAADPAIAEHLQVLANPDNYPMLIHCQHGVTRTAKLLTIYDIVYRNMSAEESLAAQPLFGRDEQNVNVRAFCRNFEKERAKLYPSAKAESLDVLRQ